MLNDLLLMKRLIIYFTLIFALMSMTAFSQRQGGGGRMSSDRNTQSRSGDMDYMMLFDYAGISLSDGQKRTMQGCIGKYDTETRVLLLDIRELNNSIRTELLKDKPDRKTIKSYIDKKKEKEALIEYMNIDRDITILETLTAEQRAMFYNYQERVRTRMRHGEGHMMR